MDIVYFLKALLKRKWFIIISSLLAVIITFLLTLGKPRLYVSAAQMSTGLTTNDEIKVRDENVNMYDVDVRFDNIVETITSPGVLSLLSYDLLTHDLTSNKPFRVLTDKEKHTPEYMAVSKEEILAICAQKHDSLQTLSSYYPDERKILEFLKVYKYDFESLKKQLSVSRLSRTDYIDMVFRSENPELSAYVVNTLYQEFIRDYRNSKTERTVENVETFQQLVEQKKHDLDLKVESLRVYKTSTGVLNVDAASGSDLELIKQFEKSLFDEKANLNNLAAALNNVDDQLAQINAGKPVYSNSNADILSLRKQINDLNEEYNRTGGNDDALQTRIKGLRAQLQTKMSNMSVTTGKETNKDELTQKQGSLKAQITASNQNIASLESRIGTLRGTLGSFANKEATVGTLQSEVTLAQDDYNKLKEKLNAAQDNSKAPQDAFRQTLKGQPAFKPESSKRLIMMALAGVAVFFLTSFFVLFKEFTDNSLKSPSLFEKAVDLKLIATINHANLRQYSILEVLKRQINDNNDVMKRENTFRELLRKLRFELEYSGKRIILMTSTKPQQGKTTLTQALAYSLSLSNKKVLILDTNFCNNDLTVQLEAKPTMETFSIPPDQFSIDKIRQIVTTYANEEIEVIGCKGGDYTPSEILPKNHLLNYLPELSKYYDFILLEGAPLNDFTDSKELANYAEGVIAIFSSRFAIGQVDRESIAFLHQLGDKFLGAVLNNVKEDYLEL